MCIDGADWAGTDHDPETVADLQRDLAASNQFTDAELAINRGNRIAATQVSRLLRRALLPFVRACGVLLGSLFSLLLVTRAFLFLSHTFVPGTLFAYGPRALFVSWAMRAAGFPVVVAVAITLSAIAALPGGFLKSIATLFSVALDLAGGGVQCIAGRTSTSYAVEGEQGVGALHKALQDNRVRRWYVVQDQYLQVTLAGYEALRPYSGSVCKVYMTPRSKLLLSLEPVKVRPARNTESFD
jgi:hypothetical protein